MLHSEAKEPGFTYRQRISDTQGVEGLQVVTCPSKGFLVCIQAVLGSNYDGRSIHQAVNALMCLSQVNVDGISLTSLCQVLLLLRHPPNLFLIFCILPLHLP